MCSLNEIRLGIRLLAGDVDGAAPRADRRGSVPSNAGWRSRANPLAQSARRLSVTVAPSPSVADFRVAIELIGRRWAGAILWALADRPHYFAELTIAVPGLSDRLLSRRLRELEGAGLVQRSVHDGSPARVSYALTEKGRSLEPVLGRLEDWARTWKLSS